MTRSPRRRTSLPSPTDGCCAGSPRSTASRNAGDLVGRRRLAVEHFERVEQVAAAEFRPELGERLGPREPVEAERVAEREQRAALARLEREVRLELVQVARCAS